MKLFTLRLLVFIGIFTSLILETKEVPLVGIVMKVTFGVARILSLWQKVTKVVEISELIKNDAPASEVFCATVPLIFEALKTPIDVEKIPGYEDGCKEIATMIGFGAESEPILFTQSEIYKLLETRTNIQYPLNEDIPSDLVYNIEECLESVVIPDPPYGVKHNPFFVSLGRNYTECLRNRSIEFEFLPTPQALQRNKKKPIGGGTNDNKVKKEPFTPSNKPDKDKDGKPDKDKDGSNKNDKSGLDEKTNNKVKDDRDISEFSSPNFESIPNKNKTSKEAPQKNSTVNETSEKNNKTKNTNNSYDTPTDNHITPKNLKNEENVKKSIGIGGKGIKGFWNSFDTLGKILISILTSAFSFICLILIGIMKCYLCRKCKASKHHKSNFTKKYQEMEVNSGDRFPMGNITITNHGPITFNLDRAYKV